MKTGLLMSVAGVVGVMAVGGMAVGGMVGGAADVRAACTTTPNCESMGYKYCASECPSGSVACPFDSSKRFCFSPKPYSVAASTCSSQCKNAGSQSCTRGGVTYYNACGSSKCKSGEECKNGSCVSTCTYTVTKASCNSQCKKVGKKSCTKNGVTYYESCGASKCSSGQKCNNGTCKSNISREYFYCCDDVGYGCSNYYSDCKKYTSDGDCSDVVPSYESQGCSPVFLSCNAHADFAATYRCE